MIKLIKLTEEEIKKLPYPETARKIGGILQWVEDKISGKEIARIKKEWYRQNKDSE